MNREHPSIRAAYVHVPFCAHRCGYCNFTVVAGRANLTEPYLVAIETELAGLGRPREIDTLFWGGGTPTQLSAEQLGRLAGLCRQWLPLADGYEWSVEANPQDLSAEKLAVLAGAGVNRISLGGQSFDRAKLELLERDHVPDELASALERARQAIPNVALDLIFGVPGEIRAVWERDLEGAIAAGVPHLSTYGLTFERGTQFWNRRARGALQPLAEELESELYETAIDRLTAAGYEHYEVSNFAQPGYRCRHNEAYWLGAEYFAFGPGAARYVEGRRETNHRSTTTWLRRLQTGASPVEVSEVLPPSQRARERLVFGLRRLEGVEHTAFEEQTGFSLAELLGPSGDDLLRLGMLEQVGTHLRLTRRGLLVSDSIWPYLLEPETD